MPLHVYRSGSRDAGSRGSVLFLHGFPFDGSMWEPQLQALPSGWVGVAPDLRGFGRSPLDAEPGEVDMGATVGSRVAMANEPVLRMRRHADDMAALIQRDGSAPVVICGLSMGGYVALALWRRHPELVRALVLADTRAETDSDEARENRMRVAQVARESGAEPIARAMLPTILAESTLNENTAVSDRVRSMILRTSPTTIIGALAGMAIRSDATGDLPSISVPTLVVVGEEDGLTPPDVARGMADRIPGARLAVVPGAGHVSNLENASAFNAHLAEFLDDL